MSLLDGANMDTSVSGSVKLHLELIELHYSSSSLVMKLADIGARWPRQPRTSADLIWLQQFAQVLTQAHLLETATRLLADIHEIVEAIEDAR